MSINNDDLIGEALIVRYCIDVPAIPDVDVVGFIVKYDTSDAFAAELSASKLINRYFFIFYLYQVFEHALIFFRY